jgi:riboflavin biosynthesis pyrimidine reductase
VTAPVIERAVEAAGHPAIEPLELLWESDDASRDAAGRERRTIGAPPALVEFYGGPLSVPLRADRPTVIANFVSTLDGVVSYGEPGHAGGGQISGFFGPDRRLMALLRAAADAVLVGAGTVRASARGEWTPRHVDPTLGRAYAAARSDLGLTAQPLTAVATASGRLDLSHPGLTQADVPVLVLTTEHGRSELAARSSERVAVSAIGDRDVEPLAMVSELGRRGARLVTCEGGPHLLGRLLADELVDELFLTVAPQIAGRGGQEGASDAGQGGTPAGAGAPATAGPPGRLALVEGHAFGFALAPWSRLISVRRAGSHLFLRYRFNHST